MIGEFIVLRDIEREVLSKITRKKCSCGFPIQGPLYGYAHSGGWKIRGKTFRVWLYFRCPGCRYEWAIWKLGIGRGEEF